MGVYKNIDGTLKPSFRIGSRGILIEPEVVYKYKENSGELERDSNGNLIMDEQFSSISIQKVGENSNQKFILERNLIKEITQNQDKTQTIFTLFNGAKIEIKSNVYAGGINVDGDVNVDEVAVFSNAETKSIKTSGKVITEEISFEEVEDDNGNIDVVLNNPTTIPSTKAVFDYVGKNTLVLKLRTKRKS